VNKYQIKEAPPKGLLTVDPAVGELQTRKLAQLKEARDNSEVAMALEALKVTAQGTDNLMPAILRCVKAYATLGEMSDVLRGVFGEYEQSVIF
jgi:methylmalonyl-CoA mutase N-terminal domain/subunit